MSTHVFLLRHAETAAPTVFHGYESDVDLSERDVRQRVGGRQNGSRLAGEGEYRAVMVGVAGLVEQAHTAYRCDRGGDLRDDASAAPFADVRDAFDQRGHAQSLVEREGSGWG